MATKKTEETPETAVALRGADGKVVTYDYGADSGAGWDNTDQDDFSIPFLNQLQALSPEVQDPEDGGVEGAKPGMFINSVTKELFKDVNLVPCFTQNVFVEWVPRESGGGLVGVHERRSDVVEEARKASPNGRDLKTPEGNDLVETRYVWCAVLESADSTEIKEFVVMAFTGTKIKRYKAIMSRLNTVKGGPRIPLFAHRIKASSTKEKNAAGQPYFNVELNPAINGDPVASIMGPDSPVLEACRAFYDSIKAGQAKADYKSAESGSKGGGADKSDGVF